MEEITDINISGERDGKFIVSVRGLEEVTVGSETLEEERYASVELTEDELLQLQNDISMVLNRECLQVDDKTKITEYTASESGYKLELFIEPFDFPDNVDLSDTPSIVVSEYELGTVADVELQQDLHFSIQDVEGKAFRLTGDDVIDMKYTSLLTNWEFDDEGEVENITVPDEAYDKGHFDLEPGDYRVWTETTN